MISFTKYSVFLVEETNYVNIITTKLLKYNFTTIGTVCMGEGKPVFKAQWFKLM